MACDYGDAVLVRSSFAGVLSEVSLGDSANQPAKRMGRTPGVPARHLSIPSRYRIQGTQRLVKGWQELNLEAVRVPVTSELRELEAAVRDVISDEPDEGDIEFAVPRFRGSGLTYAGSKPFQTFGFCMRADLDGFSARVRSAQNSRNPEAIAQLAHDIHNLMNQAEGFAKNFGKPVTPLPWAGDCANLLFPAETRMEHLADMKVIPVRASVEWTKHVSQGALFGREGGAVAWSIGIAGDESEPAYNSNGNLLVATIGSRRRPFPVGIGPGVKWSLAGEQANGLGAEETALFKPNLQTLEPPLRKVFESFCDQDGKENGNFEKARHRDLEEALDQHKRDRIKEISTVGIASEAGYTVVKPRSYWND